MAKMRRLVAAMLFGAVGLSGCGVTYISSEVPADVAGLDVSVIPLTAATIQQANASPYAPRSLPAYFRQTTGTGGGLTAAGALPTPPDLNAGEPGNIPLSAPPAAPREAYRIGVGDVLRLSTGVRADTLLLSDETDQTADRPRDFVVQDDNAVSIPEIGRVEVAGSTIDAAEELIFARMIEAGIDPTFSLEIAEFNSQRLTVGGAVGSPGVLPLGLSRPTLAEAVSQSGGITAPDPQFAVIRIYRDGQLYQIPLEDYLARADLQRTGLTNGDAVYVDTTYDLDRAQDFYESQIGVIALRRASRVEALNALQAELNIRRQALEELRSTFLTRTELGAVPRDYVYLAGEVAKPSRWELPYEQQASLADVLFDSGGFDNAAGDPSQIYVLRAARSGAVTAYHLDASNALNLPLATRMQMRPDDIIFIEAQPVAKFNRAVLSLLPTVIAQAGATARAN